MFKKTALAATLIASSAILVGCQEETATEEPVVEAAPELELDSYENQLSYLLGHAATSQLILSGIEVNLEAYQLGAEDGINGAENRIDDAQAEAIFMQLQTEMEAQMVAQQAEMEAQIAAQQAEMDLVAAVNAELSAAFLAENASKDGVVALESGLQYKVLTAGDGPRPEATSTVRVNYEGSSIDGTVFDSSYQRGAPIEFSLTQVIPGWTEGLQLMEEGSTWELYIPSALAYGEYGSPGAIGPNEALVFKVELLSADITAEAAEETESE